jgi:hypothetical protein
MDSHVQKRPHTSVTDEERSEEDIERVRAMIMGNEVVTVDEVAHALCMSYGSAHGIIQDQAGFSKSVKMGSKKTSKNAQAKDY